MFKLRIAILAAGAAMAFGSASVLAMTSNFDHSRHGSLVSSAARTTCRALASEARGDCVSAIASTEGQENRGGARAKAVHDCQQNNGGEAGATRAQHEAIVACITGKQPNTSSSTSSDSSGS